MARSPFHRHVRPRARRAQLNRSRHAVLTRRHQTDLHCALLTFLVPILNTLDMSQPRPLMSTAKSVYSFESTFSFLMKSRDVEGFAERRRASAAHRLIFPPRLARGRDVHSRINACFRDCIAQRARRSAFGGTRVVQCNAYKMVTLPAASRTATTTGWT